MAADLLRGEVEIRLVNVTEGDNLCVLVGQERIENLIASIAQADEAEADAFVGAEDSAGGQ